MRARAGSELQFEIVQELKVNEGAAVVPIFLNQWASSARCSPVRAVCCATFCRAAATEGNNVCKVKRCLTQCDWTFLVHSLNPVSGTAARHPGWRRCILVAENNGATEMRSQSRRGHKVSAGALLFCPHPVSLLCCSCVASASRTKHLREGGG